MRPNATAQPHWAPKSPEGMVSDAPSRRMPFGKQFSPKQIDLPKLLRLAKKHEGDRSGLEKNIIQAFWASRPDPKTLAMNTFLAMRRYKLIAGNDAYTLRKTGRRLLKLVDDEPAFYAMFAKHILTSLFGLQLVEVAHARASRAEPLSSPVLAADLIALGIDPGGTGGEKLNPMRLWLAKAGIFEEKGWKLRPEGMKAIIKLGPDELAALAALPLEQRAFLEALAACRDDEPLDSQKVARLAFAKRPRATFAWRNIPTQILKPLATAGWIEWEKTTAGRGAKAHLVSVTPAFMETISKPLAKALADEARLTDPVELRQPFKELLAVVRDSSHTPNERGKALEGISLQVVRLLGARFVKWRRRGAETGGAEVDLIAERLGISYEVMQVQCKVSKVSVRDVVDREAGVAVALRSNVLLIISADRIGDAARRAADQYMRRTNLTIAFFDGADLDQVERGPELLGAYERELAHVQLVRRSDYTGV